jgi:hypothetical protein
MEEQILKITKKSKPLKNIKKGDKLFVNGKEMKVDSQFVFMEHDKMKEMIIEFFNPENDREYQLRYFDDQEDSSIEIYELQGEFQYVKREPKTIAW